LFLLATQVTQDEENQNKNNPEKLATQVTQDEEKQNKNNPEKLATQVTQGEDKIFYFIHLYSVHFLDKS
jgi:hypothetical protein